MGKNNTIIIRKSPIVIVKDFLAVEVMAGLLYVFAGSVGHYAKIYRTLPFAEFLSFQVAQALFLFLTESGLILYIFFRWHREYLEVKDKKLIHREGIIYRHETVIPLANVPSITQSQGPMGKIAKYGTIRLSDQAGKTLAQFKHIPEPKDFVDTLLHVQAGGDGNTDGPIPLAEPAYELPHITPEAILSSQENERLEFKSTFRWDLKASKVNKDLEKAALKTVAAFLNSRGGHLVIGVDDARNIVGIEHDYKTLRRPDGDGFENHFSNIFHSMIGAEFRQFVKLTLHKKDDKQFCAVSVAPSLRPVYLKTDENEEFYIRTGNGTTSLKFSQAAAYIDARFSKRV